MSQRIITFTNPADANYHSIYSAMLAVTGAIPTSGILPDRGFFFSINASGIANLGDNNNANSAGIPLTANTPFTIQCSKNGIALTDFTVKGNAITFTVVWAWE